MIDRYGLFDYNAFYTVTLPKACDLPANYGMVIKGGVGQC